MGKTDLTGEKHGRLTVLGKTGERKKGRVIYKVKCECGVVKEMNCVNFRTAKSCGCLTKERIQVIKGEGLVVNNLYPKTPIFDKGKQYSFTHRDYSKCVVGELVNEYQNTACFKIKKTFCKEDKITLKRLSNKVIIRKEDVFEYVG